MFVNYLPVENHVYLKLIIKHLFQNIPFQIKKISQQIRENRTLAQIVATVTIFIVYVVTIMPMVSRSIQFSKNYISDFRFFWSNLFQIYRGISLIKENSTFELEIINSDFELSGNNASEQSNISQNNSVHAEIQFLYNVRSIPFF